MSLCMFVNERVGKVRGGPSVCLYACKRVSYCGSVWVYIYRVCVWVRVRVLTWARARLYVSTHVCVCVSLCLSVNVRVLERERGSRYVRRVFGEQFYYTCAWLSLYHSNFRNSPGRKLP